MTIHKQKHEKVDHIKDIEIISAKNVKIDEIKELKWEEVSVYDVIKSAIETCFVETYNKTMKKQIDDYLKERLKEHNELKHRVDKIEQNLWYVRIGNTQIPSLLLVYGFVILFFFGMLIKYHWNL